jgi:hypothetical protein
MKTLRLNVVLSSGLLLGMVGDLVKVVGTFSNGSLVAIQNPKNGRKTIVSVSTLR